MDSIGERIKKVRKAMNLTQQEFADKVGSKRNTVATYEMGRSVPSAAVVSLICREFNVSEDWLRNGEGDMFTRHTYQGELSVMVEYILTQETAGFKKRITEMLSKLGEEQWQVLEAKMRELAESTDTVAMWHTESVSSGSKPSLVVPDASAPDNLTSTFQTPDRIKISEQQRVLESQKIRLKLQEDLLKAQEARLKAQEARLKAQEAQLKAQEDLLKAQEEKNALLQQRLDSLEEDISESEKLLAEKRLARQPTGGRSP